jgi:hypothetical protein
MPQAGSVFRAVSEPELAGSEGVGAGKYFYFKNEPKGC